MNSSDVSQSEGTLRELAKAQKTLDDVEIKMKKFRSKKKETSGLNFTKVPYPDLNKYFSYLSEDNENNDEAETFNNFEKSLDREENLKPSFSSKQQFKSMMGKQNNSININQKLQKEKNSSIAKIEEYYIERNQALQQRIKELKDLKDKIQKDQKLLLRNNEQLEEEIEKKRNVRIESNQVEQLKNQVQKMRVKINELDKDNSCIIRNKKQLEKHIREALKSHKNNLRHDAQMRPKSISEGRCKYH